MKRLQKYLPVFLLAALGVVVTWKTHRNALLTVYLIIVLTIVQNLTFYANIRFRAPIEPFLVLLVGGAISVVASRRRRFVIMNFSR